MSDKKYNHAFTLSFSLDSDLTTEEYYKFMGTKKGIAEMTGHLIRRAMHVLDSQEIEAYDLWDSYEHR